MEDDNQNTPIAHDAPADPGQDTLDSGVDAPTPETTKAPQTALEAVKDALAQGPAEKPDKAAEGEPLPDPAAALPTDKTKSDDLYRIPSGLSGEARGKFKALSDHARTVDTEISQLRETHTQSVQRLTEIDHVIKDSGATPEALSSALQYIKAVTSGDWDAALSFIESERSAIAQRVGKQIPGVDVLAEFPDLRTAVDEMELSETHALEIAKSRRTAQAAQSRHQREAATHAETQQAAHYQSAKTQALGNIEHWLASQTATDLDWPQQEAALSAHLARPETQQILLNLRPDLWPQYVASAYASLQYAPPAGVPAPSGVTPLRPKGSGGGTVKAPQTALEAVKQKLGYS